MSACGPWTLVLLGYYWFGDVQPYSVPVVVPCVQTREKCEAVGERLADQRSPGQRDGRSPKYNIKAGYVTHVCEETGRP
jgi:hypothetical protein